MYRFGLVLKNLPGFLLVAQLLHTLPLQVAPLALLEQSVGSAVSAQELGGCAAAQDWDRHATQRFIAERRVTRGISTHERSLQEF